MVRLGAHDCVVQGHGGSFCPVHQTYTSGDLEAGVFGVWSSTASSGLFKVPKF